MSAIVATRIGLRLCARVCGAAQSDPPSTRAQRVRLSSVAGGRKPLLVAMAHLCKAAINGNE